jgi:hypothetical protein
MSQKSSNAFFVVELVNFYNQRFLVNLTEEQEEDLVAFLNSL